MIADCRQECLNVIIASFERCSRFRARASLAFRTFAGADQIDFQRQRFGDPAQGKIAAYLVSFVIDFLKRISFESSGRELGCVEEVRALDVLVPSRSIGVYAIGFDLDINRILSGIVLVKSEVARERIEAPIDVADPKVADLEEDHRMDRVDFVGLCSNGGCASHGKHAEED